jgi:lipopolysaccharide/colanic/teichoic acid biosynthesis glycosyltransferase
MRMETYTDRKIQFCDVVFSFILLMVFSPLFLLLGILIKLDSPGRIFFSQGRVGMNSRIFRMYKFRTMVNNAHRNKVSDKSKRRY